VASLFAQFIRNISFMAGLIVLAACSTPQESGAAPYAAFVMDARTGETLYSENAETRLHPASLTKMLTLYIAFEEIQRGRLSLDSMITVSKNAAAQPPSRLGLKAGQKIQLRYLIRAAAIKSANDAASAIGDAIGGNEAAFAKRMNRTAKALGMTSSTFKNANGLTANGHLSTARDMSVLGRRLFYDFPQYYNIFSRRSTDAGLAEVANTNRRFLDAYPGSDGIKTGYTVAAGFNLTASAERGGKRIIATVFGGKSTAHRNAKMAELLDLGFGKAPANAPTKPPAAPEYQGDEALVAEAGEAVDGVESGGAGKTVRVVMSVTSSPRPKARPGAPAEVVVAAANPDQIEAALAEAIAVSAPPPPPDTLEGQAVDLAEAPAGEAAPATTGAEADAAAAVLAEAAPEAAPGTAAESAPAEGTFEAQLAGLLADVTGADAAAAPAPEAVQQTEAVQAAAAPLALAAAIPPLRPAKRKAQPIFEDAVIVAEADTAEPEVITRISSSGGRHWGITVGRFTSRSEAERALLKTQLAESATLNDSLRKVVQKGGKFDANFMGLTQDQADLACRRLAARAVPCFTLGP
jgi:D-alanyl-D-alanine carboxypeptidase